MDQLFLLTNDLFFYLRVLQVCLNWSSWLKCIVGVEGEHEHWGKIEESNSKSKELVLF